MSIDGIIPSERVKPFAETIQVVILNFNVSCNLVLLMVCELIISAISNFLCFLPLCCIGFRHIPSCKTVLNS